MWNTIYSDHNGEMRVGDIELFLEIAIENTISSARFSDELSELKAIEKEIYDPISKKMITVKGLDHLDRLFIIHKERAKNEIQGIIALSTFYEALINEIAITELGRTYFKKHLDRLSHLSKWEIVLKLIYGRTLNHSVSYYEQLKKLIEARNQLVHYKTKSFEKTKNESGSKISTLVNALKTLPDLLTDLNEIDKEKGIVKFTVNQQYIEKIKGI